MNKIFVFAFLASVAIVINSIGIFFSLNDVDIKNKLQSEEERIIDSSKKITDELFDYARDLPYSLSRKEKIEKIQDKINKINFSNYQIKAYAFDSLGFYISHYSKDYERQNIFLEKNTKGETYIRDLIDKINSEGYTKATILWTNYSIRHIITYIKHDKDLNIYYGCTIDLENLNPEIEKSSTKKEKYVVITSSIFFIFLIFIFAYIFHKRKKI